MNNSPQKLFSYELVLAFISIVTIYFFFATTLYLSIFLDILGVNVYKIPLTINDYLTSFKSFSFKYLMLLFIVTCIIIFVDGLFRLRINFYYETKIEGDIYKIDKKLTRIVLIILSILCVFFLISVLCIVIEYRSYKLDLSYHFIISQFLFVIIIIITYIKLDKCIINFILIVVVSLAAIAATSRQNAISAYLTLNTNFEINNNKYILLYTFEKGFLALDLGQNYKFIYLDKPLIIDVGKNENLKKHKDSLHVVEQNNILKCTNIKGSAYE